MEVGCLERGTRLVANNLHSYCTLYYVCMITAVGSMNGVQSGSSS